ncbi:MAG: A24 family peptidase [Candidatus Woesearchaeota archaeon]
MLEILLGAAAFGVLAAGSFSDLKTREVPDWLSYATVFLGAGIRVLYAALTNDWHIVIDGIMGFLVALAVGLIMFYTGQWGGGDTKILVGIGTLLGFNLRLGVFFLNVVLVGAFYGLVFSFFLAITNWRKFRTGVVDFLEKSSKIRRVWFVVCFLLFCSSFIFAGFEQILVLSLVVLLIVFYYLWALVKSLESTVMIKRMPVSKLTEGDWIVDVVKVKGKYICGPKDLGIEKRQIKALVDAKVRYVRIKEGIPFVPSFFIALVATYFFGNWFVFLV